MKRIVFGIIFLVATAVFLMPSYSMDRVDNESEDKQVQSSICDDCSDEMPAIEESTDNIELARRGCCSHHKGVCGCDEKTDRIICCDGTLSPTCKCSTY